MTYIIIAAVAVFLLILYLFYEKKTKSKKTLQHIRSNWGKIKNASFHIDSVSKYSNILAKNKFHQISEQTIQDIDFHQLFAFVDRTNSRVGQQFLYAKLIRPTEHSDDKLKMFTNLFTENASLREKIQVELSKLNSPNAFHISSLLEGKFPPRPKWLRLLILDVFIVTALLFLSFKYPVCLILLIVPLAGNMFLHYRNKNGTFQFIKSFPQLNLLIYVSNKISKMHAELASQQVDESISVLKPFQRKTKLLSPGNDGTLQDELSQLGGYVIELIKALFLIEIFALFHLIKELETKMGAIFILFEYVGLIDTSISVASLRAGALKTCQPEFVQNKKELSVKNLFHPLIENCVKNDLQVDGKSILITGSNMSGKSTFLRTLAINSILAQTIDTCFADEFKTPFLKQFSSIRIDDNLFEGRSFYFEEVNVMASLVNEVESAGQKLFILDEVFKGTNTIERIASAKAILSYLNHHDNIVIVSTHDIELVDMLKNDYDLYHFAETIENNQLHFDHAIKRGPLKTRNAIKILEISGYPQEIINEARQISQAISNNKQV